MTSYRSSFFDAELSQFCLQNTMSESMKQIFAAFDIYAPMFHNGILSSMSSEAFGIAMNRYSTFFKELSIALNLVSASFLYASMKMNLPGYGFDLSMYFNALCVALNLFLLVP